MSEPLDLEVTPELVRQWVDFGELGQVGRTIAAAYLRIWEDVDRLRDEIADRANVEADLRAQLAEAQRDEHP